MNEVNTKNKRQYKSILCVAVLSALAMPLQATAGSLMGQGGEDTALTVPQARGIMLVLGQTGTKLSGELAGGFNMTAASAQQVETQQAIAAKVAGAKALHINMGDFYGDEPRLNSYINEAMKQRKLMVFENTKLSKDIHLDALPFMVDGDVVLFQPSLSGKGDKIAVYGGGSITSTMAGLEQMSGKADRPSPLKPLENLSAATGESESITVADVKLADLQGEELQRALTTVSKQIDAMIDEEYLAQSQETMASASGGSIGYTCPTTAKNERLCWAAIVIRSAYNHSSGDAQISILGHYSVALYRTDQATTIFVSPHGSANPVMKVDNNSKRAFYLKSVKSTITPTSMDGMALWSRYPGNANNVSTVTSSSGMSYGISGGVDTAGPSMGGSIGYSTSNSVSTQVSDWKTTTSTNGSNAVWDFSLNKYTSISAWVDSGVFRNSKLRSVPDISKYGLQYTAEGIWVGDQNKTGTFEVNINNVIKSEQIYFTTNNWFQWAASTTGWTYSNNPGSYWFNNGWLKDL
jgi:hypothetical protein